MGLSIGLGIAVVIINFIVFEESFDTFYPSYHQIYRVAHVGAFNGNKIDAANSPLPEAPAILEDIPEVAVATRFYDMLSINEDPSLSAIRLLVLSTIAQVTLLKLCKCYSLNHHFQPRV